MYHLKLIKALSYLGVVKATKDKPDVYTDDEATANAAVASGYFKLVEDTEADNSSANTAHFDKSQLEDMKIEDLKGIAADMGIDTTGFKKKSDYVEAISAAEVIPGAEADEDRAEVYYGEGSATMVELQSH